MLNVLWHVLDSSLVATPRRLLHFWASSLVALCYIITNVGIWAGTSLIVYDSMDWTKSPGLAAGIAIGSMLMVVPIVHLLWCGFTALRQRAASKLCWRHM